MIRQRNGLISLSELRQTKVSLFFILASIMTPISVEEANGIIEEIMLENGGIDDETRKKTPIQTLKSLKSLRQKLAAATST